MKNAERRQPSKLPLTVLAGINRSVVADLGAGLLLKSQRLALIWADPFTAELGYIQTRVTDSDGRCTERTVDLEHGCLSCAMREGVERAVRGLASTGRYDAIVIHLHPGVEADAACAALTAGLQDVATLDSVVAVLGARWLDELAGDATVNGTPVAVTSDDDRTLASILAADIDVATAIVFTGETSENTGIEEHAALTVLAPEASRLYPPTTLDLEPRHVISTGALVDVTHDRLEARGLLHNELALPQPCGGQTLVRWHGDRPLHPQRLHDALDEIADGVVRSTGYLWLASRPDLVVGWDSAGDCLQLGPDRYWEPDDAPPRNSIGFLGDDLDGERITGALDGCALTDTELAAGAQSWWALADPFPDWSDALPRVIDPIGSDEGAA